MKKTIMIILLICGLVVFGCLGSPNAGQNNGATGGNTNTVSNGGTTGGESGSGNPDYVVRPNPTVTGTAVIRNPVQDYNRCLGDCQIVTGTTNGACRVGCIMEYAEGDRNVGHCALIDQVSGVEDMRDTYYNGCLDVVGSAMGSIAPCAQIRGSTGVGARKNACISAVAAESRQPALCDSMQQDNTDPDPLIQQRYDESLRQIIQDCKESAEQ